jgi:two-component system NarL family sensor kinase
MGRAQTTVARAVVTFAASGLVILLVIGVGGTLVLRRIGTEQARREAERLAAVSAHGVIEPRLRDGILTGNALSLLAIDSLVNGAVLEDPIVAVRIWDPVAGARDGRVIYADRADLIDETYPLDSGQIVALDADEAVTEDGDLSLPQNASQGGLGSVLDVTVPIATPSGHRLLFEASIRSESVTAGARRLWLSFLPVFAAALVALALVQIPFAVRLARRVRRSQLDRERLLRRAIDSSDQERRRIAADLHDGSVQQLAGLSMSLAAAAESLHERDAEAAAVLRQAASSTRRGMRSLRAALMGIYPQRLEQAGLRTALNDLAASAGSVGVRADVAVPEDLALPPNVQSLLYRASREALRNVVKHAGASHVRMTVAATGDRVVLEVSDDGVGFSPQERGASRDNGHVGLTLLGDLVRDADGTLTIVSAPGEGTVVRVEVPVA